MATATLATVATPPYPDSMTEQAIPGMCRGGCGNPVPPGYNWHQECLQRYRASADYRALALTRDGYECARCWPWRNRAALAWYAWRWAHTPQWLRHRVKQHRPVEVDHIQPLAGRTGTHDSSNLQVLCKRHHATKTKRDLARLRSQPTLPSWARPAILAALLFMVTLTVWGPQAGWRAWLVTALVTFLAVRQFHHYRTVMRMRLALAHQTGDSDGKLRTLRARRWRWRRIPGLYLPRLRPTRLVYCYPRTFADHDPNQQTALEARVASKCGGTWSARWHTEADRVALRSPDPLVGLAGIPWPNRNAAALSLWDPIPIGLGEDGRPVTMSVIERNFLIGGEPGSGKSVAQSMVTATAALDLNTRLHGIDGKGMVELGAWAGSMDTLVGGVAAATALLKDLAGVMDERYKLLRSEGRRKIARDDGLDLHVLIIDELALFTAGGTRGSREPFVEALRDVISRGRAAGVITIAATQRPSADVVPTQVRDLMGFRLALRCATPQSSDMVLGQGWAAQGHSAAKVPADQRGTGLLLAEDALPVRLRTFHIPDPDLAALAGRAAALRAGTEDQRETGAA